MTNETNSGGGELGLSNVVAVLLRRWRTIALVTVVAVAVAVPVALLQPKQYQARAVAVPVSEQGGGRAAALAQLPPSMSALVGITASQPANQRLISDILKSRALAEHVAARLEPESPAARAEIARTMGRGLRIERTPDGSAIAIDVRADDPQRAAAIANQVPGSVNEIVSRLSADGAMRKREYLLVQLDTARENLIRSEQRLLAFQRRHNVSEVSAQAERTVEAAAQLQQMVVQQELVVAGLRRSATPENPQLQAAVAELNARRAQLRRLTAGDRGGNPLFLSMDESPELKVEATRMLRDYTRDEQVYVALSASLAETELGARNDMPVITVLDDALVPAAPLSRTRMVVAVAGMLGLLAGIAAAFLREYTGRGRTAGTRTPLDEAWDGFRSDVGRLVPGRNRRARVAAPH